MPKIIGYYGSDNDNTAGWYKVCTISQSGYNDNSLNLLITQGYSRQATGILYVHTRCDNSTGIGIQSLKWMYRYGFNAGDVIVTTGNNTWSLYVYQSCSQYGRIQVKVISKSGTSGDTTFTLSNNNTKEASTPRGTAATDGGIVQFANTSAKATQDESGNNIKSSYGSSISISDHTITLKNKNGASLGTVTVPDNNTWRGIQNNLTSDSTTDSLSAAQGKVLKGLVDGKAASSHTHNYAGSSSAGGVANSAAKLATARTINGTSFDGSANITTANWGTARDISIADSDATNTGAAVSVNGSGNATLKLPATIKASLTGNASTASALQDYNSTSNTIQIGYSGSSLTSSEVAYLAAYKSGGKQIKDVSVSTVKTLMGIKNSTLNVTCSSSNWSGSAAPYTNTINVTGVTASNIVEVGLNNESTTDAQVQACMKASIAKITQENGKIKLYAYGTKPTVNIPMTVVILTT